MPTYDYSCEACGHAFEQWQSMTAAKLKTCPQCGKKKLVRLMGRGAGVIFRGSGFYETDYKRNRTSSASGESASSESPSTPPSGSSDSESGGGSDSKSASTTLPKTPSAARSSATSKSGGPGKKKSDS